MRRISKKKLLILFAIVLIGVIIAISIGLSRALKKEIIQVNIVDSEGKLVEESITVEGIIDDEYHYIDLPKVVNSHVIEKYYIDDSDVQFQNGFLDADSYFNVENTDNKENTSEEKSENATKENTTVEETTEDATEDTVEDTTKENVSSEEKAEETSKEGTNKDETSSQDTTKIVDVEEKGAINSLHPYDFLFLSPEQIETKSVTLKVKYDYIENEGERLYKKEILADSSYSTDLETFNSRVGVEAYLPEDATIELTEVEKVAKEVLESNARSIKQIGTIILWDVYDLEIKTEEEFNWKDYQDKLRIKIRDLNDDYTYNLFRYDDVDLSVFETNFIKEEVGVIYTEVEEIENYVLMVDSSSMEAIVTNPVKAIGAEGDTSTDVWDGTAATSFFAGTGTAQDPYLITSGAELKYLQNQVAGGNNFAGKYIKLACNIDLNARNWTPIGSDTRPFKGIFDGTGLTISNAQVVANNHRYGLFGAIGDGANKTQIINLQISGFNVGITESGGTFTFMAGAIVGEIYQNAMVENCIVKNTNISVENTTYINGTYDKKYFVGGIAGRLCNTGANPENTPQNPSNIINCAVDAVIETYLINLNNNNGNVGYTYDCATGGIVGAILYHNNFPQNCYFTGEIDCGADFVGPIFGAMRSSTFSQGNNYDTEFDSYWVGDTSLTMNSYYGDYYVYSFRTTSNYNSSYFTSSQTTGTTPNTETYRVQLTNTGNGNRTNYVLKKRFQGMNKGTYTNNRNQMLTRFNNTASSTTGYLSWEISNGFYSLINPFSVQATTDADYYLYTAITNPAGTYTYRWNVDGNDIQNGAATINVGFDYTKERDAYLLATNADGTVRMARFTIPKSEFYLTINYTPSTNSLAGEWAGNGRFDTAKADYTKYDWQWYSAELAEDFVEEGTSRIQSPYNPKLDYKLVATLKTNSDETYEAIYWADRNVIYVNSDTGNDGYDGRSPERPKLTMQRSLWSLRSIWRYR